MRDFLGRKLAVGDTVVVAIGFSLGMRNVVNLDNNQIRVSEAKKCTEERTGIVVSRNAVLKIG